MSNLLLGAVARQRNIAGEAPAATLYIGRVNSGDNDAEETTLGGIYVNSPDLEIGSDDAEGSAVVGVRFTNVNLPRGSLVNEAYLQFTAYGFDSSDFSVTIHAEAADNAAAFTYTENDLTDRNLTSASVEWEPEPWATNQNDEGTRTPNLAPLISEVINRAGWTPGNAIVILIGEGPSDVRRRAIAYDHDPTKAPQLFINQKPDVVAPPPSGGGGTTPPEGYLADPLYDSVVAFEGAMGWGANATGGRGNGTPNDTTLYTVDNLNNSGSGSLRAALEASGKRVIVPRVSGYVRTTSRIVISDPDYTFLGQLAPGDGLALRPDSLPVGFEMLRISAGNGIIRYLRVRSGETSIDSGDCIMIYGAPVSNVILDHVSAAFATDGLFDLNGQHNYVTAQNCAFTYPLANAGHSKGRHDFGILASVHKGSRLSLLYNFWSQGSERWPYIQGGPLHQFIGNTVYNTQHNAILAPSTLVNNWNQVATINFQRNYYKVGPRQHMNGGEPDTAIKFRTQVPGSGPSDTYHHSVYLEGNMSWHIERSGQQSSMARVLGTPDGGYTHPLSEWLVSSPFATPDIVWRTWDEARDYVAANAGASLHRDSLDQKAINEMLNNTGPANNPSSVAAAGGYPSLSSLPYPAASDGVVANAWRSFRSESRAWYELTDTGRMVIEDYADDIALGRWVP